jgi:hypothetical protein
MSDEPFFSPKWKPPTSRQPTPGEVLFEFVRATDGAAISCELRDHRVAMRGGKCSSSSAANCWPRAAGF